MTKKPSGKLIKGLVRSQSVLERTKSSGVRWSVGLHGQQGCKPVSPPTHQGPRMPGQLAQPAGRSHALAAGLRMEQDKGFQAMSRGRESQVGSRSPVLPAGRGQTGAAASSPGAPSACSTRSQRGRQPGTARGNLQSGGGGEVEQPRCPGGGPVQRHLWSRIEEGCRTGSLLVVRACGAA